MTRSRVIPIKVRLANKILTLADGKDRSVRITEAQGRDSGNPNTRERKTPLTKSAKKS
jgi:hypothetical protein